MKTSSFQGLRHLKGKVEEFVYVFVAGEFLFVLPGGKRTTSRRLMPEFKLAIACLCNEYRSVPG